MALPRDEQDASARNRKLQKVFFDAVSGKRSIANSQNARIFVEAVCSQADVATCISKLVSKPNGLDSVQSAVRVDISLDFMNSPATELLQYFQAPELKAICGGDLLRQILLKIVEPPIFWDVFVDAFKRGRLQPKTEQSFAWLLLQLLSFPVAKAVEYLAIVQDPVILRKLISSPQQNVRLMAQRIKHITEAITSPNSAEGFRAGGRHDNDFPDARNISILPTPDEIASKDPPFLRRATDVYEKFPESSRFATHVDNQFRLLREDMVRDLREELHFVLESKKTGRRGVLIDHLIMSGVECDLRSPWSLLLKCAHGIPQLRNMNRQNRNRTIDDTPSLLKHGSLACLLVDNELAGLVTIVRDEDLLKKDPPFIRVQISPDSVGRSLLHLKTASGIGLVQLNTAVFAYEPVLLQLKETKELSLESELLHWNPGDSVAKISYPCGKMADLVSKIRDDPFLDLKSMLGLPNTTCLEESQANCFVSALSQRVSSIQGPPGTGKSFIGALIAKAIHKFSKETILVVCYTNHALDQFLEDLLDTNIPSSSIVRLGSSNKASPRTRPLLISEQRKGLRLKRDYWALVDLKKGVASFAADELTKACNKYLSSGVTVDELFEYIEIFVDDGLPYFDAFQVPKENDGMTRIGAQGKGVRKDYLLQRWATGKDAGMYKSSVGSRFAQVWKIPPAERVLKLKAWKTGIVEEHIADMRKCGNDYNSALVEIDMIKKQRDLDILHSKRIIGCTTTAAAKYVKQIQAVSPAVLLVEEAGEILESHILTALGPETKQMILIGDHKQLRPKAHYDLSVEQGDGYDLNRSLFERLILRGYPYQTLYQQHRMRPEISSLVRQLTYPNLVDASRTKGRSSLRGFTDNVIFVDHRSWEDEAVGVPDWRDATSKTSKKNTFEVDMVLKCVRYLSQQGYKTDDMIVLTPYLAQLRLMMDVLGRENDPVLNDLDSYELVRAGLVPAATAKLNKSPLRISTIDNYQGEERQIVIVSLTRSNSRGDIGFLSSPERLNVLISRARDALIILGNASTFVQSRKGGELWTKFTNLLKEGSHIYSGFPVKCERHPDRRALLSCPEDFDDCPDGGCMEPCGVTLNCGLHQCPSRCHQLYDHSKMPCNYLVQYTCPKGHIRHWKCHLNQPQTCITCEKEDKRRQKELEDQLSRQRQRDMELAKHSAAMEALNEQIRQAKEDKIDARLAEERVQALEQKKRDLETARKSAGAGGTSSGPNLPQTKPIHSPCKVKEKPLHNPERIKDANHGSTMSASEKEWERQKLVENAKNDALDELMNMTGLESVKSQFLMLKSKIETVERQHTDLKHERFGIVLLGNPGTGKTTVARLYAKFLVSFDILPGNEFIETTGSHLANEGVNGAKGRIDKLLNAGGGAFFVDEAYQLTEQHNYGGAAVLDFLLTEIENRVGKIVFILAGYNKQMEKFFQHNQGFDSRIPYRVQFADYEDAELLIMFRRIINKKYNGRMELEDGCLGLYARIAIRRLGRSRGREGFGNARALENLLAKVSDRQASRLRKERASGISPDDFLFTKEDLIGPEPSEALLNCVAWKKLQQMIGLQSVKNSVQGLLDRVKVNYDRELQEKPPIEVSLNRVFSGSPGTGKTTVGKLYGQILVDLGLLTNGEVVMKNPSDFIGDVLGASEKNTKDILRATEGKVLIIDEAYMLSASDGRGGGSSGTYRAAVIDTIVAEVQSTPGEDRCVLLLGYEDQMQEMFQNCNPGLSRRFQLADAFHFEDFDDTQLCHILELKLKQQGLAATDDAKKTAIDVLGKARLRPNFGNAGEVENLISHAKAHQQQRQSKLPPTERAVDIVFEPEDFDENYNRSMSAVANCRELFADIVGCEAIVEKLEGYQKTFANMKARNLDPRTQVPFNFIFKGPPGTGKTTTARKMGKVFYDMGMLSSSEVIECSATDLIGQYVGQTGPKTQKLLEKALGKVLFIDEAYRLGDGHFATEAMDEIVDSLTKTKYAGKIVVILAGYDTDMNQLLSVNQGLSSRFAEEIIFSNMLPKQCLLLLKKKMEDVGITAILDETSELYGEVINILEHLGALPSWGNGRDIETIAKYIISSMFKNAEPTEKRLEVSEEQVIIALQVEYSKQKERCTTSRLSVKPGGTHGEMGVQAPLRPPEIRTSVTQTKNSQKQHLEPNKLPGTKVQASPQNTCARDPGVSDQTWMQLQSDRNSYALAQKGVEDTITSSKAEIQSKENKKKQADVLVDVIELAQQTAKQDQDEMNRLKKCHEEARLKALQESHAVRAAQEALEAAERKKREEAKVQHKLRTMGVCPQGFAWIKQFGGYRCSGGMHFVGNHELGVADEGT
ncbi:hypothetical protein AJ78_03879 [Emergomyces pasteurianus Ep9510]|uniref:AAA+ ATPase domain-containing protein n=1 Tax=Emergomyces pasteurianus Ep9510 TaxID=1447872 RepID=A0A1J9QJ29_9EURO|nr:hypothetical protein AJ78_03879 [Emergomyces pasteurianus Ep9510]